MNAQSYQAFTAGMDGLRAGLNDLRQSKDRKEALKRQLELDAKNEEERQFQRTMTTKQIELQERGEKRARDKMIDDNARGAMDDVLKEIEANRRGQETAARVDLLKAQTTATKEKPTGPLAAQLDGLDQFGTSMADALTENSAAMEAQRAAYQQPDQAARGAADTRVLKAQLKLSGLQQIAAGWQKNVQKEPTVDIQFPGEDGESKMTMKVPQSQWNSSHPMWGRFMGQEAGGGGTKPPAAGGEQIPTLTPDQARAAKPGTKFKTTDGRILVR